MSDCNCKLMSMISRVKPDMMFVDKEGNRIDVVSIHTDENGKIFAIKRVDQVVLASSEFTTVTHFLEVPGIGFLPEGIDVYFRDVRYNLKYGRHTNISNQDIESWYLTIADEDAQCPPKTLYFEMIDEIDLITFH